MNEDSTVAGQARSVAELTTLIDPHTTPTPEQAAIIGADLSPTLVVAGAGSGKTETLSMRMVYLLDHGEELFGRPISPDEILCLTFTRKAAAEIAERSQDRIAAAFGEDPARPPVSVATYNGYSAALVAEHGLRLGVDPESATVTNAALWQLADQIVSTWTGPVATSVAQSTLTQALVSLSGQMREHLVTPDRVRRWATSLWETLESLPAPSGTALVNRNGNPTPEASSLKAVRSLLDLVPMVEEFQRRMRDGAYLNFSDQVAYGVELAELPAVQAIERSRYRVVLLDEFQDTSPAQLTLFARMFGEHHPVMAVGDPNQAIYGFRGASASALSSFVTQFGGPGAVVNRTLSVSWRNEASVLDVANAVAATLPVNPQVTVEPLRSKGQYLDVAEPQRPHPGVVAHMAADLDDEADAVAQFIIQRRADLGSTRTATAPVTAAVLCRRRAQFPAMVAALTRAGLDYEVVGLGGLIDTPEVAELMALLHVVHDPSRGDSLMRLLAGERLALGPRDLIALKDWADRDRDRRTRDDEYAPTIVDALDDLPDPHWVSAEGRSLSMTALERLRSLQSVVRAIREHTYLSLTELIVFAERAWGLDIEAEVSRPGGRAVRNVDAFLDAARGFASGAEHATLGAFLAWLDAARREESGLTAPVKEPEPDAVQILTAHSAKGLEWDVVAVPGLTHGTGRGAKSQFPSGAVPTYAEAEDGSVHVSVADSAWMSGTGNLPFELRLDRDDLPLWDRGDVADRATLGASISAFKADCGIHRLDEERRLFYVALTRARSHVLLSGSWWSTSTSPSAPSLLLQELLDGGYVTRDGWAPEPGPDAEKPHVPPASAPWPPPVTDEQASRRALAREVSDAMATPGAEQDEWDPALPLARDLAAMLAERDAHRGSGPTVPMPGHLTTSALVSLTRDRDAFADQLRRPLPQEPTVAAEIGNALHAWIEAQYGHTALLSVDELDAVDGTSTSGPVDELTANFAKSEWAARTPSDIEVRVELPVAGVTIRSRIDAVFPPGAGLERVTVVDWKSGRPPRDDAERAAREVQLAVYRLAWAEWKGLDIDEVDAAFYYAASDTTVWPRDLLTRAQIIALITADGEA
ncbi:ATP-dependent DNA helicase [Demequina globuliformis]|uniref:ATP-dependent DNA helicase n=1 Tax=Demequina globuliformis TaxID=676202 RepID=UPI000785FC79|nr:ATP-dependent DNA helicase [Demequina globuliformis]